MLELHSGRVSPLISMATDYLIGVHVCIVLRRWWYL